jgi:ABC-type glycerol-3-phosphate transport system substrate-binding protein
MHQGYTINAVEKYVGGFEKATGAHVKIEVYDEPTELQKEILDCASKTGGYDVILVSFWHVPEYHRGQCLEPLNDYWNHKRDPWLDVKAIPKSALNSMSVHGQIYALPDDISGGMFFYRTDIFQNFHIKPPYTTAQILAAAHTIKKDDPSIIPNTGRGNVDFANLGTWLGWAWGYGTTLYDSRMCPQAAAPKFVKAISDYYSLMTTYGPKDASSLDFGKAAEQFRSGHAAMEFDNSGFGAVYEDPTVSKVVGKVGFTLPVGPAGQPLQWTYTSGLGVSRYSRHRDLAWLFLQWRTSDQLTRKEMLDGRMDVPNLHVLQSAEYQKIARQKHPTAFTSLLPRSWREITIRHWPYVPEFSTMGIDFMQQISAAEAGQQSLHQALNAAQSKLMQVSKQAGYC